MDIGINIHLILYHQKSGVSIKTTQKEKKLKKISKKVERVYFTGVGHRLYRKEFA